MGGVLQIDEKRYAHRDEIGGQVTGISVRAHGPNGPELVDLMYLTRDSLLEWLAGRDERFLKSLLLTFLGHAPVRSPTATTSSSRSDL